MFLFASYSELGIILYYSAPTLKRWTWCYYASVCSNDRNSLNLDICVYLSTGKDGSYTSQSRLHSEFHDGLHITFQLISLWMWQDNKTTPCVFWEADTTNDKKWIPKKSPLTTIKSCAAPLTENISVKNSKELNRLSEEYGQLTFKASLWHSASTLGASIFPFSMCAGCKIWANRAINNMLGNCHHTYQLLLAQLWQLLAPVEMEFDSEGRIL